MVKIFTDGACKGNPGPGGWGAILTYNSYKKEISGFEPETTNNRMELTAVIESLKQLKFPCSAHVTVDSKYVMDGAMHWMKNWKKNNWKTKTNKPVKNIDLWKELDSLLEVHDITWEWVRGHTGHELNERADSLATTKIKENT